MGSQQVIILTMQGVRAAGRDCAACETNGRAQLTAINGEFAGRGGNEGHLEPTGDAYCRDANYAEGGFNLAFFSCSLGVY